MDLSRLLLLARSERPCHSQSSNSFNEGASPHCRPQGPGPVRSMLWNDPITAGICDRRNGVQGSVCTAAILNAPCPLWSKADVAVLSCDVRFTPNSGHRNSVVECPLCAKSGHCAVRQRHCPDRIILIQG